jgi:LPS sulfotransferase NodH
LLISEALGTETPSIALSCLVASTPAAGGDQLSRALGSTGALGVPDDYFNPLRVPSLSRRWKVVGSETQFPARYLTAARSAATGGNGVCSARLLWSHLRWLVRMARAASVSAGGASLSDAEQAAAWFPNARYVYLRCEDTARQALRWYAALHGEERDARRQIGPGAGSTPDFQEIRWLEALIERHEHSWQSYFHLHGIGAEPVVLERFQLQPRETVEALLESLGLTARTSARFKPSRFGRLDAASAGWMEPYLAVRPRLSATVGVRVELP